MIKDPNVLYSLLNTKLRDFYPSLDALCEDLDYDKEEILSLLDSIHCYYDPSLNQFREKQE